MEDIGIQDQWDKCSDAYQAYFNDDGNRISTVAVFPKVLQALGSLEGKRVLDFGCGQGRFCRRFYDAGARVVGFDCSESELEIAQRLNDGRDILYVSNLDTVTDQLFDYALCFMTLLCNAEPESAALVEQIYRRLKPQGISIFVNTNTHTLGKRFKDFYSQRPSDLRIGSPYKTFIPTSKGVIEVIDHYYTPEGLRDLFERANFDVVQEDIIEEQFVLQALRKSH
ncbi:MAG: methyltransferase domain-containing protein [Elainellaceae cyanobacterium]